MCQVSYAYSDLLSFLQARADQLASLERACLAATFRPYSERWTPDEVRHGHLIVPATVATPWLRGALCVVIVRSSRMIRFDFSKGGIPVYEDEIQAWRGDAKRVGKGVVPVWCLAVLKV